MYSSSDSDYYDAIVIYADGSCLNNGQSNPRAGYGVYCPDDERINFARRLEGRQTNQRAEIMAARCALLRAAQFGYDRVIVRLDSIYVKKGVEVWLDRWERNDYEAKNKQDFQALRNTINQLEDVEFEKVSRDENEMANDFARLGATFRFGEGYHVTSDDI